MKSKFSDAPVSDLTRYIAEIRRHPVMTAEEEYAAAKSYIATGDTAAGDRLVASHLRLVVKIAKGLRGYGLPISDLVAEGNIGLMLALQRFDPDRGARFSTYATWWIRAEMQDYIMRSQSLVKTVTTAAQKKLFFNLRRMKADLSETNSGDLPAESVTSIATALDVPEYEVVQMNRRLAGGDLSLNATAAADQEMEFQDLLVDDAPNPETWVADRDQFAKRHHKLEHGLARLTTRERDILTRRRLVDEPLTLESLSQEYGISRERVRQIEMSALAKLRKSMTVGEPEMALVAA
jgi:RNA polymerase sigma-32 factor